MSVTLSRCTNQLFPSVAPLVDITAPIVFFSTLDKLLCLSMYFHYLWTWSGPGPTPGTSLTEDTFLCRTHTLELCSTWNCQSSTAGPKHCQHHTVIHSTYQTDHVVSLPVHVFTVVMLGQQTVQRGRSQSLVDSQPEGNDIRTFLTQLKSTSNLKHMAHAWDACVSTAVWKNTAAAAVVVPPLLHLHLSVPSDTRPFPSSLTQKNKPLIRALVTYSRPDFLKVLKLDLVNFCPSDI